MLGVAAVLGATAGVLIGTVGVGGIILVPSLNELPIADGDEEKIKIAIASCMLSYMAVGAAGGLAYARRRSVNWANATPVIIGALPGGFGGSFAVSYIPALGLKLALYICILLSALYSLHRTVVERRTKKREAVEEELLVNS